MYLLPLVRAIRYWLSFMTSACLLTSTFAVQIVAHRGASFDAPENTLAAQTLAWEQKADAVETDLRLSKDGKIVVIHDATFKRTAGGGEVQVADLSYEDARSLDAGAWKSPQFQGEKLPSLDEQLAAIPTGKRLFIELKVGPEIVPELARTLTRAGVDERQITIISFNIEALKEVRRTLPHLPTQFLVGYRAPGTAKPESKPQPTLKEVVSQAIAGGFTGLDLQHTWPLGPAELKTIRDAGLELHVWTVDDPAIARHWIDLGATSITTNRPGWLREQLGL